MLEIRLLTIEEMKEIYGTYLVKDFPKDEVKPFWRIEEMYREGIYSAYGCYEEGALRAYQFLVNGEEAVLLDYFAVLSEFRAHGYGSVALKLLQEKLSPKVLLLESENPSYAKDEADLRTRERRLSFYQSCDMRDSGVRTALWGVEYWILCYGETEVEEGEARTLIERIYDRMFLPEQLEKYCVVK